MPQATCPTCDKPAHRLFGQTVSPKSEGGTGRSTNVNVPVVWCGDFGVRSVGGRLVGVYSIPPGCHGAVALDPAKFLRARLAAVPATTKAHPELRPRKGRAKPRKAPSARPHPKG